MKYFVVMAIVVAMLAPATYAATVSIPDSSPAVMDAMYQLVFTMMKERVKNDPVMAAKFAKAADNGLFRASIEMGFLLGRKDERFKKLARKVGHILGKNYSRAEQEFEIKEMVDYMRESGPRSVVHLTGPMEREIRLGISEVQNQ